LIKSLEDINVCYDGTVRNSAGCIIQFLYGEDGLAGEQVERQNFKILTMNDNEFIKTFKINLDEELGSEENDDYLDNDKNSNLDFDSDFNLNENNNLFSPFSSFSSSIQQTSHQLIPQRLTDISTLTSAGAIPLYIYLTVEALTALRNDAEARYLFTTEFDELCADRELLRSEIMINGDSQYPQAVNITRLLYTASKKFSI
jgi:hypothetical protein